MSYDSNLITIFFLELKSIFAMQQRLEQLPMQTKFLSCLSLRWTFLSFVSLVAQVQFTSLVTFIRQWLDALSLLRDYIIGPYYALFLINSWAINTQLYIIYPSLKNHVPFMCSFLEQLLWIVMENTNSAWLHLKFHCRCMNEFLWNNSSVVVPSSPSTLEEWLQHLVFIYPCKLAMGITSKGKLVLWLCTRS